MAVFTDEIIVPGLVRVSGSSLLLELLAAPAAQAALPSAGGNLGALGGRQKPCSLFSQGVFLSAEW